MKVKLTPKGNRVFYGNGYHGQHDEDVWGAVVDEREEVSEEERKEGRYILKKGERTSFGVPPDFFEEIKL